MIMRKIAIAIICLCSVATSQAALIALWSFDSSSTAPASGAGSQAGSASMITTGTSNYTTGTTLNDPRPSPTVSPAIAWNSVGGSFTLQISGSGLTNFSVTYAAHKNGNSGDQIWSYSTDGINFTNIAGSFKADPSYTVVTVDFGAITALNGANNVYFKDTFGSDITYDNIQVTSLTAVPEPVTLGLAVFGVCAVAWRIGRRVWAC